ncbi:MAG TPA: hypothetical protein PL115_07380 [Bacteroidales bacterium]|mgnify:FL=1|jgi:hypothetical protein|nr:hypothetical protein [Bacteroidales bacterium]HKM12150.1 hypothetical protein [Bacteroidales bacterium]HPB89107.1 hypothetical protein [Bacteroidales bacterium]HPY22304.1 hypothetical protein [Bacteroidales bacterium]HQA93103.1 hypothetical protein [Bacteroidales bacterium]
MRKILNIFTSLMLVFLAVGCYEKYDPYQPAEKETGPQVYFYDGTKSISLASDKTSFDLKLGRIVTSDALTVGLTVTGEGAGLLAIPSSVTFPAGSATTKLTIGYSFDTMGYDNLQAVVISITDPSQATEYGSKYCDLKAVIPSPWTSLGTATLIDNFYMGEEIPFQILQNDINPKLFRMISPYGHGDKPELRILDVGETYRGLEITEPDLVGYDDIKVTVNSNYGAMVYILHPGNFTSRATAENYALNKVLFYKDDGVTPGLVQIAPMFYMFGIGGWNAISAGNVFINFPGFEQKDYSVEATYSGAFTDSDGISYVAADVVLGEDVEEVRLAVVQGTDGESCIKNIVQDAVEYVSVTASGRAFVPMPQSGSGLYSLVAVAYGGGKAQGFVHTIFMYVDPSQSDDLVTGTYLVDSTEFDVYPTAEAYKYVITSIGIANGSMWWAYYDPSNHTFTHTGIEYEYEEYGNQFGGFYGYYGSRSYVYTYESFASASSDGTDPMVFKVDAESKELSSVVTKYQINVYQYAAGFPFVKTHYEIPAGTPVEFVPAAPDTKAGMQSTSPQVKILNTFKGKVGCEMASKANFVVEN